ncbi:cellulase family glycosylhydrolase [Acutalibacter caecimuris]|uniref:cellulase family glycosylhydrolase n=1 Tax=Acutalibacter caecimuris TaxID=3093657 RepID=UPI002AC9862F|nr:cellulase family glycosylhydrolase [Acutalibacter sp. M00118]
MVNLITKALRAALSFSLALVVGCPLGAGATAAGAVATGAGFTDVKPGSWYAACVEEMAGKGLVSGYPDGSFKPNGTITAAEFLSITARCAGVGKPSSSGHWAKDYLQAGLDRGWYDWDEIPPTGEKFDKAIPRQLAVKALMRALLPDKRGDYSTESAKMKDFAQLDGRYYESVLAAYACGVVSGDEKGCFNPKSSLTRAEACVLISKALKLTGDVPGPPDLPDPPGPVETISGGVGENGWLQVKGTQLCNEAGQPIALHGMSSHGLQWFGQFAGEQSIKNTASYGANLFRVAMYTGENGYLSQPEAIKKQAIAAIDAAIRQDMYVIIDWHILSDGNPMDHLAESQAFFQEIAARYKDQPAVLYEICNEPNGGADWGRDIKPYAEKLVETIRGQSEKGVILIGSSTWSQDVHLAAANPVKGDNLMYTLHFYAGTHGQWLRDRADAAMAAGLPVFVTEWGTSSADGNGGVFLQESQEWLDWMEQKGISWANWSLCDKSETSAALRPGTSPTAQWAGSDLSESGRFVFRHF